uniref:Terpene synthase metal-binding domain-containing protein n=1 Tax=Aegilops tauschii subsp. strangulata TaxID=200361 RepID=A0A453A778_AEGTS
LVPGYLTKFYNKLLICFKEFDNELRVNRRYSIDHIKKKPRNNMDVANCVECYASEHKVAEEVAFSAIDSMIEDEWRTTNQARFQQGRELLPAVQRVVNLTLSVPVYYGDRKDAFTFSSHLEDIIKSLFVKPIPI